MERFLGKVSNEACVLKAFLADNRNFKILFFNDWFAAHQWDFLEYKLPLCTVQPECSPFRNCGASLWLQHRMAPWRLRPCLEFHREWGVLGRIKALWAKGNTAQESGADALKAQGDASMGQGDLDGALQWYAKAVAADPHHLSALIRQGFCLRELGRLDAAEQVLQQALAVAPLSAEAHYLLAGLAQARGQSQQAIDGLFKVLECDAGFELAYHELCFLLFQSGRVQEAKQLALSGLVHFPQSADLHFFLGNIQHTGNESEQAVASFCQAVALAPGHAHAWVNLGDVLLQQGQADAALDAIDHALTLMPVEADWHVKRGYVLQMQNRIAEAVDAVQRAIELQPGLARAHANLGSLHEGTGQPALAVASYERAVALAPDDPEILFNLGAGLSALRRFDEAMACYRKVLQHTPGHAKALINAAAALTAQGKVDEALACYDILFDSHPDIAQARMNKAYLLLQHGRYAEGWPLTEYRWQCQESPPRPEFAVPHWLGREDLQGKSILLYGEQGFGDKLHFLRYASLVAARGATAYLLLPPALRSLAATCPGVAGVFVEGEALPPLDFVCALMSLPAAFCTELNTVPADVPYLRGDLQKIAAWRARMVGLAGPRELRVGIAWAGDPRKSQPMAAMMDQARSMHFEQLLPLLAVPGVAFFSLQLGDEARQQMERNPVVADFTDALGDFQDTASLIENLDLVISVDTSIVHLSGALGKPVWMMDRFGHCYRWLAGREDSPWYPSLRIFRQETPGDWPGVVARVKQTLEELSRSHLDNTDP